MVVFSRTIPYCIRTKLFKQGAEIDTTEDISRSKLLQTQIFLTMTNILVGSTVTRKFTIFIESDRYLTVTGMK